MHPAPFSRTYLASTSRIPSLTYPVDPLSVVRAIKALWSAWVRRTPTLGRLAPLARSKRLLNPAQ